jgi:flavin-dependent dehydrogenase
MFEKDLIIVGAGPSGLKAGEEAARLGIDYMIIDKGV